ncbi:MAG: helix-turn-helix transcriptional regulator [Firmicutes bacterium]|nr:helix-turn-helix transcriptional regulator [Bacillota bacterium]
MDFVRIGSKVISRHKLNLAIDKILDLRVQGYSQSEVAKITGIDRSFISRLETLGEVKKGQRLAVVGFPVGNKQELEELLAQEGVEYTLLLTEEERWAFFSGKDGAEVFNELMCILSQLRQYDVVIFFGSDMRNKIVESILGSRAVTVPIGESPIKRDVYLDPAEVRSLVRKVRKEN